MDSCYLVLIGRASACGLILVILRSQCFGILGRRYPAGRLSRRDDDMTEGLLRARLAFDRCFLDRLLAARSGQLGVEAVFTGRFCG
jgi:hypothetical protein